MKNLILSLAMTFIVLPASIGATTITGIVRNSVDSTAVVGAKVVLIQGATRVDSTTTNGAGSYSLLNVTNGAKQLQTSATGYNTSTTNTTVDTAVATSTVDIYIVFTLPGSISGTVSTALDSNPVANALVLLRRTSATSAILDSARTNASGMYAFDNLTPGTPNYYLAVSSPGFINAASNNIAVANGTAVTRNFYLTVPGSITGAVISAADSIAAIIGAKIYLRRTSGTSTILDSTLSDSSGEYIFNNVTPGTPNYWITASFSGLASVTNTNVAVPNGGNVVSDFYLAPVAPGSISGFVKNASDSTTAVSGAVVYLRRSSATGAILDSTLIDGSGGYSFDNLAAGSPNYFVTASAAGFQSITNSNVVVPNNGNVVSNFYLAATVLASIDGVVRSLPDSMPIVGAKVYLRRTSATSAILDSATTDAVGAYLFGNVAPGTPNYYIAVTATGFIAGASNNITVANGAAIVRNFYLTVAVPGTITGTVRNSADSLPIAGAKVYLRRSSATSAILDSVTTNVAGTYTFSNVSPGTPNYWITVSAAGFPDTTSANVALANGGATTTRNYLLTAVVALHPFIAGSGKSFQFIRMGNQLIVNIGISTTPRMLKVYDLHGAQQHQIRVAAGESRAIVPVAFAPAKGYLYQVK